MKRTWKIVLLALAVVGLAIVVVARQCREIEVPVKRMQPETIFARIEEEAIVRAGVEYDLYPRLRSKVKQILVEEGDRVEQNQLLMVLDSQEFEFEIAEFEGMLTSLAGEELKLTEEPGPAAMRERELAVQQAEAQLAAAEREYQRMQALYAQQAVSDEEYRRARDRLTDNEFTLARTRLEPQILREAYDPPPGSRQAVTGQQAAYQARIDRSRYMIAENEIRAPASGVVGRLGPEEGQMADPQQRLLTLFADARLRIESDVLAREAIEIRTGMPVELTLELRDRDVKFPGRVVRIAPQAEMDVSPLGLEERRVKVTIEPDPPEQPALAPGYEVDAAFITDEFPDSLTVPNRSVFTEQGQDAVFVAENGRARIRTVTTGFSDRFITVIEYGLQQGDMVILDPRVQGLREGARVRPQ